MPKLKITLVKSPIGYAQNQKDTARSLGFKKMQQTIIHEDNPVIRGMVHKIKHLVVAEQILEE